MFINYDVDYTERCCQEYNARNPEHEIMALARRVGVSRQTIISLEKGKYNPSIMLAHLIAIEFGTTIEEIFIFEGGEKDD